MKLQTLLLFVLLIGAGTSNITAQEECKRHIEPQGGFSICPPAGWSVEERQGEKYKHLFAPRVPRFTANINFRTEANTMPLAEYVATGIKLILASAEKVGATSIKLVSQEPFVTDARMSGIRVTYRTEYKGFLIRTRQYFFNGRPGEKLVVTATELEADQAIHDPVFDRAVKSFQLER